MDNLKQDASLVHPHEPSHRAHRSSLPRLAYSAMPICKCASAHLPLQIKKMLHVTRSRIKPLSHRQPSLWASHQSLHASVHPHFHSAGSTIFYSLAKLQNLNKTGVADMKTCTCYPNRNCTARGALNPGPPAPLLPLVFSCVSERRRYSNATNPSSMEQCCVTTSWNYDPSSSPFYRWLQARFRISASL
jgi:hypothetical protein